MKSQDICPFGSDLQKYWNHRYRIFSKFDAGIKVDRVGLFSATPESVALKIALEVASGGRESVLDAFCGVGGNTIGFAMALKEVFAIEVDRERLEMAKHNTEIYGIDNKVRFFNGDFLKLASGLSRRTNSVFLDPPWGGPDYISKKVFLLSDFWPNGEYILQISFMYFKNVIIKIPNNFDEAEFKQFRRLYSTKDYSDNGESTIKVAYFF